MQKRKKPKFPRQNAQQRVRQGTRWRKPKGMDSKQREGFKSRGNKPSPGFGQPKAVKNKHPSGYYEILIKNLSQLNDIDVKKYAIRISSTVGMKKKAEIVKKATEKKIKILNPKVKIKKKKVKKSKKEEPKIKKSKETPKKEEPKKTEKKKEEVKTEKKA